MRKMHKLYVEMILMGSSKLITRVQCSLNLQTGVFWMLIFHIRVETINDANAQREINWSNAAFASCWLTLFAINCKMFVHATALCKFICESARGRSFNDDDSLSLRQHARALYTKSFHQIIILKGREKSRARARLPRKWILFASDKSFKLKTAAHGVRRRYDDGAPGQTLNLIFALKIKTRGVERE